MLKHKILNEFTDYKTKEQVKPSTGDGYYKPRDPEQLSRLVSAGCLDPNDTCGERTEPAAGGPESAAADTGEQGGIPAADAPAGSDAAHAADADAADTGGKGRGGKRGKKAGAKTDSGAG